MSCVSTLLGLSFGFALASSFAPDAEDEPLQPLSEPLELLSAAREAAGELASATYVADLEIRSPGEEHPKLARAARIELGPRGRRSRGQFVRPFRIEGAWTGGDAPEPFTVAFDGRTLRHLQHERKLLVEEQTDGEAFGFLEPMLLLAPGLVDESALEPSEEVEVSLEEGETLDGRACEVLLLRHALRARPGQDPVVRRVLEQRFALDAVDLLPRRWVSEIFEERGAERTLQSSARASLAKLEVGASADPERFLIEKPEGYHIRRKGHASFAVGDPAPLWTLADTQGVERRLSTLRGQVVVLDFWGTWCPPCVRAMPELQSLHERYRERGVTVIGISVREPEEADPAQVMRSRGITYLGLLEGDSVASAYGVGGVPHVFVLAKDGTLAFQSVGMSTDLEQRLSRIVEKLLAE